MNVSTNSFFVTGGTLRLDSPSYVERQADKDLYAGLLAGEFCYVLTSRQMGKSSLMVRTVKRLRLAGAAVAVLDLTAIGQNLTPEQWYDGLMARLGQQLDLEDELLDFWRANPQWGPLQRWLTALEKVILPELKLRTERELHRAASTPASFPDLRSESRLVVFIDEIDVVRSLPFSTDEFFAALRECYNRRTSEAVFNRLAFCLIGVATPSDLVRETRMTPFNIGRRIELTDFSEVEAGPLASGLAAASGAADEAGARAALKRILHWTGGHPYLTQRLCRAVAEACALPPADPATGAVASGHPAASSAKVVDQECEQLFLSARARERDDNLIFVRERLLHAQTDRASLLHLYGEVRRGKNVADEETNALVSILHLAGITRSVAGKLRLRNRIYSRVFDLRWVIAHMPDAELRRQKEAFRRGVVRTSAVAACLFIVLVAWLVNSLRSHNLDLSRKLPDSSVLILEAVIPRSQPFEFGVFRSTLLDTLTLPFRKTVAPKKEFHFHRRDKARDEDTLVAWFTRKDPADDRYLNLENFSHLEILDNHGCRMINWVGGVQSENDTFRPFVLGANSPMVSEDASVIVGAGELSVYPRGQKAFTLNFIDRQGAPMASFTNVPNPAFVHPTVWRADMLPATQRDGDLAVTLKDVTLEINKFTAGNTEIRSAMVHPEFELSQTGQPTEEWELGESLLMDASGNRVKLTANPEHVPVAMLCLREPAWRLRMEFFRKAQARFPESDLWRIGSVNLPAPGLETQFIQTNRLHNLSFKLLGIHGGVAGGATNTSTGFVPRGKSAPSLRTHITLQIAGRAPEIRVTLQVVDNFGYSFSYAIESPVEGIYQVFTELPAASRAATLTLIAQKPRIVAFAFKPPTPIKP